jgi:mitogen-activated protein kinase organizer 1
MRKFRGHDGAVNALRYSPNDEILVSGGYDAAVKVWDCRSRSIDAVQTMPAFGDSIMSVAVTSHAAIIAGSVDGTIRRFDVRMGRQIVDLVHHSITCIAHTKDNRCILAACVDGCVRLLDQEGGDLLNEYRGHVHASAKLDAAFMPSDAFVVACSEDGRLVYWDLLEGSLVAQVNAHEGEVVCSLAVHPEGHCVLSSSVDGTIKLWR